MQKNILITGCSSGLGFALTNTYLENGYKVYGISRNKPNISNENFIFKSFDLSKTSLIKEELTDFITNTKEFECVFLNAGILGEIKHLKDISIDELTQVYNLNVYSNKELLDILMQIDAKNIIIISSGASKNGYEGWGSYSLSKAGVNMLVNLYSKEIKNSKILALAPGVIKTSMTDFLRFEVNKEIFTSIKKLESGHIQTPTEASEKIFRFINKIEDFESGSYVDIREVDL